MPFFTQVVTILSRFSPAEIEQRLRRVTRKPRTLREVLQRMPPNSPEHPSFVGFVGNGQFELSRLADVPSSVGWFQSKRPCFRGVINPTAEGSEIRINFFDAGLCLLAIGMIVGVSTVILANTRGLPLWRIEHAIIVFVVVIALGACRYSLHQDVEKSLELIQSCLKKGK